MRIFSNLPTLVLAGLLLPQLPAGLAARVADSLGAVDLHASLAAVGTADAAIIIGNKVKKDANSKHYRISSLVADDPGGEVAAIHVAFEKVPEGNPAPTVTSFKLSPVVGTDKTTREFAHETLEFKSDAVGYVYTFKLQFVSKDGALLGAARYADVKVEDASFDVYVDVKGHDGNLEVTPGQVVGIAGTVRGNVNAEGALVVLRRGAVIEGNLNLNGGELYADGATVDKNLNVADASAITLNDTAAGRNMHLDAVAVSASGTGSADHFVASGKRIEVRGTLATSKSIELVARVDEANPGVAFGLLVKATVSAGPNTTTVDLDVDASSLPAGATGYEFGTSKRIFGVVTAVVTN